MNKDGTNLNKQRFGCLFRRSFVVSRINFISEQMGYFWFVKKFEELLLLIQYIWETIGSSWSRIA